MCMRLPSRPPPTSSTSPHSHSSLLSHPCSVPADCSIRQIIKGDYYLLFYNTNILCIRQSISYHGFFSSKVKWYPFRQALQACYMSFERPKWAAPCDWRRLPHYFSCCSIGGHKVADFRQRNSFTASPARLYVTVKWSLWDVNTVLTTSWLLDGFWRFFLWTCMTSWLIFFFFNSNLVFLKISW